MDDRRHIAYVSYNGLCEPLGASQILPYIEGLGAKYRYTIISFEKLGSFAAVDPTEVADRLTRAGHRWIRLRYHRKLGLISKAQDIRAGAGALRQLLRKDPPRLVHARGYVPAAIAHEVCHRVPFLFDIRGLQAEESVDAGTWRANGLRYRLTKWKEHRLLRDAAGIVTLTHAVVPILRKDPALTGRDVPWEVIPCAVDLRSFRFDPVARARIRRELGCHDDEDVFVYSGSIGTWYAFEDSLRLVAARTTKRSALLLIVTTSPEAEIRQLVGRTPLSQDRVFVRSARRDEIPAYLSAADRALCLVRPVPSKVASSPTKVSEALACGLPILCFRGVGDIDAIARDTRPGLVTLLDPARPVWNNLPGIPDRRTPREVAERLFDLQKAVARYDSLYARIALP